MHSIIYVALQRNEFLLLEGIAQLILNIVLGNSTFCQLKVILHYIFKMIMIILV